MYGKPGPSQVGPYGPPPGSASNPPINQVTLYSVLSLVSLYCNSDNSYLIKYLPFRPGQSPCEHTYVKEFMLGVSLIALNTVVPSFRMSWKR